MAKASDNQFPKVILTEQGSTPANPASGDQKLFIRTSDHKLCRVNSSGSVAVVEGSAADLVAASYSRTAGDYTVTSTSFVDVDATNMKHTITTGAHRVMIVFSGEVSFSNAPHTLDIDVDLDGSRVSGQAQGIFRQNFPNTNWTDVKFVWITDALSAASHTFKLQWKVDAAATATMYGAGSAWPARFSVVELLA